MRAFLPIRFMLPVQPSPPQRRRLYAAYGSPSGAVPGSIMNGWYETETAAPGREAASCARALSSRTLASQHHGHAMSVHTSMTMRGGMAPPRVPGRGLRPFTPDTVNVDRGLLSQLCGWLNL